MKKSFRLNKILLFLFIFAGVFFFSNQAHAFFDVIPSMASMGLGALDFIDQIIGYLFKLLLLAIGGSIFITFSAAFLDWASTLPVGLNNPLVQSGWQFLSGFANIIFILIFVAIAFSYIFKLETWGMKKALPRLIIIAFLLNFSMLFVKMFVDLGFLVQNAFKQALFGDAGLAAPVAAVIAGKLLEAVGGYSVTFGVYYALALVPFLNVARAVLFATTMLGGQAFFGTFSQTILLTVFGFVGGLIFFTYALLFLARIIVIWLLAIMAPLAFAAFILPQTQKYFSQWLKALFQWTFLGIVVFFLMGLGLKLFTVVTPPSVEWQLRGFDFVTGYTQSIFLILYLFIALMAAKKFTPAGANAVWSIGAMATGGIGAAASWAAKKGAMKTSAWQSGLASKGAESRMKTLQTRMASPTITLEEKAKLETQLGKWTARKEVAEARGQVLKGLQIQEEKNKLSTMTKGMDEETARSRLLLEASRHKTTKIKGLNYKDKSSALSERLAETDAPMDNFKDLYEEGWRNAGPDDVKKNRVKRAVLSKMPNWATDAELEGTPGREGMKEKWNVGTIEKWSNSAKEDDRIIKTVVGTLRADLMTRLGASTGKASDKTQAEIDKTIGEAMKQLPKTIDAFKAHIQTLTTEQQKVLMKQLEVVRHLHHSTFGEVATWKKYGTMDKNRSESIPDRINELRKVIK